MTYNSSSAKVPTASHSSQISVLIPWNSASSTGPLRPGASYLKAGVSVGVGLGVLVGGATVGVAVGRAVSVGVAVGVGGTGVGVSVGVGVGGSGVAVGGREISVGVGEAMEMRVGRLRDGRFKGRKKRAKAAIATTAPLRPTTCQVESLLLPNS